MKLLVSGCTRTMARLLPERPDRLGVLLTPENGNRVWWPDGVAWACDNGCFGGLNVPAWLRFLAKVFAAGRRPLWVAAPDVVGDAVETGRRFCVWEPVLRSLGLPVALVAQDGLRPRDVPWGAVDALFVGGSTEFKLSDAAGLLTREARDRGKLCHFGRVNSLRRIRWIARGMRDGRLWCDTLDGGSATRWGDTNLPKLVRWVDEALADRQAVAFGGTA